MTEAAVINLFTVARILLVGGIMFIRQWYLGCLAIVVACLVVGLGISLAGHPVAGNLTNGIADNSHWVWGVFYVNRNDPSIMVEKRFGVGYTINFGNRWAVLLMVAFLALILGLSLVGALESIK